MQHGCMMGVSWSPQQTVAWVNDITLQPSGVSRWRHTAVRWCVSMKSQCSPVVWVNEVSLQSSGVSQWSHNAVQWCESMKSHYSPVVWVNEVTLLSGDLGVIIPVQLSCSWRSTSVSVKLCLLQGYLFFLRSHTEDNVVSVNSQEPQLQRKSVILCVRQRCSGELATKGEHNQDFFFFSRDTLFHDYNLSRKTVREWCPLWGLCFSSAVQVITRNNRHL